VVIEVEELLFRGHPEVVDADLAASPATCQNLCAEALGLGVGGG
jgi:hypothetical protein